MIELIGTNAGLVWNALNEGGKMSVKAVKKATKIKAEKDMYAAFGWLAKEGKLAFENVDFSLNGLLCVRTFSVKKTNRFVVLFNSILYFCVEFGVK